jgi:hypothetical protein
MRSALFLLLGLAACSRGAAEPSSNGPSGPPIAATAASAAATAATTSGVPAAAPVDPPAARPDDTLFGLLGAEAQNRPRIQPNADDVYGALQKAGYAVGDRKQSLGRTYKAAYCTGAYTKDGSLAVDVCEYPDEAAAKTGLAAARTLFPGMSSRTVVGHKATILTVINQRGEVAADARAKRIATLYASL